MSKLLQSKLRDHFEVHHVDTSDRRTLDNLGRFDFHNVVYAVRNLVQLAWYCVTIRPDLVYVPNAQNTLGFLRDGLFILIAAAVTRAKIVMHYHGGESFLEFVDNSGKVMRTFIDLVLRRVDLVIVVGERLTGIFSRWEKTVVSVPNGIDLQLSQPIVKSQSGQIRVSFLSTLVKSKGVLDTLKAAIEVHRQDTAVEFHFAGMWWSQETETEVEFERLVKEHQLESCVYVHGPVIGKDKVKFLEQTDIFVFPSLNDSFGIVNLEAMAAACPVISSHDVGAIPEVVLHGETGILVDPGQPSQIAEAILRLVRNPVERRLMGEAGRRRYLEVYTFEKCAERMISVFNQVITNKD